MNNFSEILLTTNGLGNISKETIREDSRMDQKWIILRGCSEKIDFYITLGEKIL